MTNSKDILDIRITEDITKLKRPFQCFDSIANLSFTFGNT